jgi:hypothetical protein
MVDGLTAQYHAERTAGRVAGTRRGPFEGADMFRQR